MTKAGTVVIPITAYINADDAQVHIIVKIGTDINLERIPGNATENTSSVQYYKLINTLASFRSIHKPTNRVEGKVFAQAAFHSI